MTGKELGIIIQKMKITREQVANELNYTKDGIRSWIRRDSPIPPWACKKIDALVIRTIKAQQTVHQQVLELLILRGEK